MDGIVLIEIFFSITLIWLFSLFSLKPRIKKITKLKFEIKIEFYKLLGTTSL